MSYFDSEFIPGCESWMFEDDGINAEININADEADEADSEALAQSSELEQEGGEIEQDDQNLTMQMYAGFNGYMTLERINNYISNGGNYRDVMALYDLNVYLKDASLIYGNEELKESIKTTAGNFKEFLKRIWSKLVTLIQRIIPWFGQNLTTLKTRIEAYKSKYGNIKAETANANFKNYKNAEKKVVSYNGGGLSTIIDKVVRLFGGKGGGKSITSRSSIKRDTPVTDYNYKTLGSIINAADGAIADLAKSKGELDKKLSEANDKLKKLDSGEGAMKNYTEEREKAMKNKSEITAGLAAVRAGTKGVTTVLNDIKFLLSVAA